jgi:hypothetical protein
MTRTRLTIFACAVAAGMTLSALGNSVISEAEASRYMSSYDCNGRGAVTIKVHECWSTGCSYQFIQGGKVCGWAIWET